MFRVNVCTARLKRHLGPLGHLRNAAMEVIHTASTEVAPAAIMVASRHGMPSQKTKVF
jgi:hypothetical protein